MAAAAVRICGYAIVSADGMIADGAGRMPPALIVEADQLFFRASLAAARIVVHGRHSAEGGPAADGRPRIFVTRTVAVFSIVRAEPAIVRWNPLGMPFTAVLEALGIDDGIVAVVGGTDVFDLFLGIGYDAFYLSRDLAARLPGGRPLFRAVPERSPEDLLSGAGLRPRGERLLEPGLTLATWERTPLP
ncbi:MAG TPA: hypothetical protein VFC56_03100 [Stellaceae bacterium]|nr:hypothetical protein [Stellaceae bacterium]